MVLAAHSEQILHETLKLCEENGNHAAAITRQFEELEAANTQKIEDHTPAEMEEPLDVQDDDRVTATNELRAALAKKDAEVATATGILVESTGVIETAIRALAQAREEHDKKDAMIEELRSERDKLRKDKNEVRAMLAKKDMRVKIATGLLAQADAAIRSPPPVRRLLLVRGSQKKEEGQRVPKRADAAIRKSAPVRRLRIRLG